MNSDKTISMFTFCYLTFQSKNIVFPLLDRCLYETEYLYLKTLKEYVQNRYNITLSLTGTIKSVWIFFFLTNSFKL